MPVNLDALLRYHTINNCLQTPGKAFTWEELANACATYADEVAPRHTRNIPSKRTIQNDIKIMRSGDLGYYAPIKNINGKYFYETPNYSIKNATLNQKDIEAIKIASKILGQYKGFNFFEDLNAIFEKFESKLHIKLQEDYAQAIVFEKVEAMGGAEFLHLLLKAIRDKHVLNISYKKFNDSVQKMHVVHPYFLKEYAGRWYLIGWHKLKNKVGTLALDRILAIEANDDENYLENTVTHDAYFSNALGITYNGQAPEKIILQVDEELRPYLLSVPLHHSQKLVKKVGTDTQFSFLLVLNQELEHWIMAHSHHIKIITPQKLKSAVIKKIAKALSNLQG